MDATLPTFEVTPHIQDKPPARVVLVHGTFASSSDDCGEAWWQVGSPVYKELQKRLPPHVSLAEQGQVFRWSGENHERARGKAARELLRYLAPLEAAGQPYHLIGHSHGGSVIWQALLQSTMGGQPLSHLQSWSTVGTPFLRHRTRSPWNVVSMTYMLLAAMLLIPAGRVFWFLFRLPYSLIDGQLDNGLVIQRAGEAGPVISVLRAPVLQIMEGLGVAITETADGIKLGSFDPDSGQSIGNFLFLTGEGWVILTGIVMFGYLTLLLGSWFIRPVLASLRIRFEVAAERKTMRTWGQRWLAIWSPDDEALNGLRATLNLTVSFVAKLAPRERVFFSDSVSLLSRPCFWMLAPFYNRLFRPSLDSMIRGRVVRTAQGNNRPAAEVVDVAASPLLPPDGPVIPALPEPLCQRILNEADRNARNLGPDLRKLIAEPSFVSGLERFGKRLNGRELVHTSYFDHPEIIQLLAMNICWSANDLPAPAESPEICGTRQWFLDFKRLLADHDACRSPSADGQEASPLPTRTGRSSRAA
jgi:hypothetical protein